MVVSGSTRPSSQPVSHPLGQKQRPGPRGRTWGGFPSLAIGFVISRRELFSAPLRLQRICPSHSHPNGKNQWILNSHGEKAPGHATEGCAAGRLLLFRMASVPGTVLGANLPRTKLGGRFIPNSQPSPLSPGRDSSCRARRAPAMPGCGRQHPAGIGSPSPPRGVQRVPPPLPFPQGPGTHPGTHSPACCTER